MTDFTRTIRGKSFTLIQTAIAAPEQYDLYIGSKPMGYMRFRHGTFRTDWPCHGEGNAVYSASGISDATWETNRYNFIDAGLAAILDKYK